MCRESSPTIVITSSRPIVFCHFFFKIVHLKTRTGRTRVNTEQRYQEAFVRDGTPRRLIHTSIQIHLCSLTLPLKMLLITVGIRIPQKTDRGATRQIPIYNGNFVTYQDAKVLYHNKCGDLEDIVYPGRYIIFNNTFWR